MVNLGELITPAKNVKCGAGEYPVLSMTMHNGLVFQDEKFKKEIASNDKSNYKVVYRNQLVISFPIDEGVLAAQRITDAGIVSPAYAIWDINQEKILPEYLERSLRCERALQYYKANLRGSTARRRSLPTPTLLAFKVPLPSIDEQIKVLEIIHTAEKMKDAYHEEFEQYDLLIKARFVEMFGDRWLNNLGWEQKTLKECASFYNGKAHEQVVDEDGEFILVTSKCIASDQREYRRTNTLLFPLKQGDICMVMSDVPNGRALAKCMIIDENNRYTLNQRICCLRNYSLHPVFFLHTLNRHEYFLSFNDGDSQTNLRKEDLLECPIIVPPMELQQQFAAFVAQIDKSKVAVQKALDETQLLFDSLMQEYFG